MLRPLLTACLPAALLFASPAAAVEVVLRDTIGCDANGENCDSTATDAFPTYFTGYNTTGSQYSMPGNVVTNTLGRSALLSEVRTVISFNLGSNPLNDIGVITANVVMDVHVWKDGVLGAGDSYANNPGGVVRVGQPHDILEIDFGQNATLTEHGGDGNFNNYILAVDISGDLVTLSPSQEVVYSTAQRIFDFDNHFALQTFSRIMLPYQDLASFDASLPDERPGFLMDDLGLPITSFASFVSAEFLEGDYNGDGVVDAADYTVWRDNLGTTGLDAWAPGDGNGDGDITLADYDVWRSQYGTTLADLATPTPAADSLPIPEPASVVMGVGLLACGRRRR